MYHLPGGMHARIRPSSTDDIDPLACNLRHRGFQGVLHSLASRLRLPAAKRAPVIFNTEGNSHFQSLSKAEVTQQSDENQNNCDVKEAKWPLVNL